MDEDYIESGEPIYELASDCEKLFSKHVSKLKDEADFNGSKVVGEYQQQFSAWAAFLGVFAVPEMCLDRRLQRHVEIQDLVLRLLDIMKRNLTYLFKSEDTSDGENIKVPALDGGTLPQPQLHISIESLGGIKGAIERLHHLGSTIQLSSEVSQATRLGKFAAKFDSTSFEQVAHLAIISFYPDASPSLMEHLARAMTEMYQKFHYNQSRHMRLQPRSQLQLSTINEEPISQIKEDTWKVDSSPAPPPPINDTYKRLARPRVLSHLVARSHQSKDSTPTSLDSQEFKKLFQQRKDGSVMTKTRSIAANLVAYPQPSDESLVCDWCFSPLAEDEFKGDKWKKHLNEDFKPFLCLSEKCSKPLQRFATSKAWFSHMLETHGHNWHREVHLPAWWICPLCNDQETTYSKAQDLSKHISKLHGDVFSEQQVQVIVHQSRLRAPRPQDVCPLCCLSMKDGQDPDEDDQVVKKASPKLSVKGVQLAESFKRIKTETGSIQLDQHNDVNAEPAEQTTLDPQTPSFQSQGLLNARIVARHVAAHLQGLMLFSLRMMALDAVAHKSTEDTALSGDTDDDLSRLGSNQQYSLPQTQEMEDINDLLVQDESMDVDDLSLEDAIPDCEHDMNWQDLIPNMAKYADDPELLDLQQSEPVESVAAPLETIPRDASGEDETAQPKESTDSPDNKATDFVENEAEVPRPPEEAITSVPQEEETENTSDMFTSNWGESSGKRSESDLAKSIELALDKKQSPEHSSDGQAQIIQDVPLVDERSEISTPQQRNSQTDNTVTGNTGSDEPAGLELRDEKQASFFGTQSPKGEDLKRPGSASSQASDQSPPREVPAIEEQPEAETEATPFEAGFYRGTGIDADWIEAAIARLKTPEPVDRTELQPQRRLRRSTLGGQNLRDTSLREAAQDLERKMIVPGTRERVLTGTETRPETPTGRSSPTNESPSATETPVANEGRVRARDMAGLFDGLGEGQFGSPRSPSRPHSMRRNQNTQVLELEARVEQLIAENRLVSDARHSSEQNLSHRVVTSLSDRDTQIEALNHRLKFLKAEVSRLTEANDSLASANAKLANKDNSRYADLQVYADQGERQDALVQALRNKDAQIASLTAELDADKEQIHELQRHILGAPL
ncbi:uncharacterized protein TrAtP1_011693 [Trichoderma atroviride]|uniref:uncharacterized protein n=1 Tax=Hypocrea atroviridis TaxID=63577 RepID=UPI0033315AEE|nr:hypothetical protein TrAtP1_011693 [Trichoderma atroviride]